LSWRKLSCLVLEKIALVRMIEVKEKLHQEGLLEWMKQAVGQNLRSGVDIWIMLWFYFRMDSWANASTKHVICVFSIAQPSLDNVPWSFLNSNVHLWQFDVLRRLKFIQLSLGIEFIFFRFLCNNSD
jgi:hypothetical protein